MTASTVSDADLSIISKGADRLVAGAGGLVAEAPAVCGAQATFESTSSIFPETVCADRQYPGLGSRPWLGTPQPGSNPCPAACVLALADQTLYLSLDPKFLSLGLSEATLKLGDDYLKLDVPTLLEKPELVIEGVPVDMSVEKASLLFKVENGTDDFSTESELIVKQ